MRRDVSKGIWELQHTRNRVENESSEEEELEELEIISINIFS